MTYMIEEAARGLARLELFRRRRREPTVSEIDRAYEEHGRVYRTDARAALLEGLCVNDDELVEAIARALMKEAGWGFAKEALRDGLKLVKSENPRAKQFCRQAVAAIQAIRALAEANSTPEDAKD